MLARGLLRPFVVLAVLIVALVTILHRWPALSSSNPLQGSSGVPTSSLDTSEGPHQHAGYTEAGYREIFSTSTRDRRYFKVDFSPRRGINPNAIPHPTLKDHWVIVGQLDDHQIENSVWFAELVCTATFEQGTLLCVDTPLILSIGKTPGNGNCTGDVGYFNFGVGPRDARIFYGPTGPWAIYGSLSQHTCLGLWIQDFRILIEWPFEFFDPELFRDPTEIQRPDDKYNTFEKNYFVFWDNHGLIYAHYDMAPRRVFAQLSKDGSAGPDLAPQAAAKDELCMARHMPKLTSSEHVHQATNSISITLCRRADLACTPDDSNTFILTIFQVKKCTEGHCMYDPYVMLFQQEPPFSIHSISTKPLWISGRGKPGEWESPEDHKVPDQTQMFYVTSVSWKKAGLGYHGFIDDVLFIFFGIEDNDAGGIDVVAGDLLADMGSCSTT